MEQYQRHGRRRGNACCASVIWIHMGAAAASDSGCGSMGSSIICDGDDQATTSTGMEDNKGNNDNYQVE